MNLAERLLDTHCIDCGTWGTNACDTCITRWVSNPVRGDVLGGVPVVAVGTYRSGLRSLVLAAKHRGAHALIRRIGGALRELARDFGSVTAIPIPSSRPGFLARGYGLASVVARAADLPIVDCLVLNDAGSQKGRHRSARLGRSVTIGVNHPPTGTRVVIVDDVVTTGATMLAAIEACHRAGLRVVGALTVASARHAAMRAPNLPNSRFEV